MKVRQVWRLRKIDLEVAERVQRAIAEGEVILTVPAWLSPEASRWLYVRKAEHATQKWISRTAEVPIGYWQQAVKRHMPRQERGGD